MADVALAIAIAIAVPAVLCTRKPTKGVRRAACGVGRAALRLKKTAVFSWLGTDPKQLKIASKKNLTTPQATALVESVCKTRASSKTGALEWHIEAWSSLPSEHVVHVVHDPNTIKAAGTVRPHKRPEQ